MSAPRSAPRNHQTMSRFVQRGLQSRRIHLIGLGVIALLLASTALARASTALAPPAPVVLTPANGTTTTNNRPTISGTAESGSTVTVYIDGAINCTTIADASGNWSCTVLSALPDGDHTVKARATDGLGGESGDSNINIFTIDTTPPPAPVTLTPANGSIISETTPTVSGTAEAGSMVMVYVDNTLRGTTTANAAGSWSFTLPTALSDGSHTARAIATDAAGNSGVYSNTNTFTIDTTPPPAPVVLTPADGSTTSDNTPTVSGSAEPESTVTVFINGTSRGTTTASAAGTWSFTLPTALADGPHSARAVATDGAGNSSPASNTNTFTVNTAPPETIIYIPRITRGN